MVSSRTRGRHYVHMSMPWLVLTVKPPDFAREPWALERHMRTCEPPLFPSDVIGVVMNGVTKQGGIGKNSIFGGLHNPCSL